MFTKTPTLTGLFKTHLYVSDLKSSILFYQEVLGIQLCYQEQEHKAAFFWIGEPGQSFLGLWKRFVDQIDIRHFAFESTVVFVRDQAIAFLKSKGLKFQNFLKDDREEPMVFSWIPALSIYFSDPDGPSLEFIARLEGPARPDIGVVSYDEWKNLSIN